MKRSQMIKVIKDALYPHIIDREEGECPDYIAEVVLQSIEGSNQFQEGMLPPFDPEIYHKSWRDGGSGHEWEQE